MSDKEIRQEIGSIPDGESTDSQFNTRLRDFLQEHAISQREIAAPYTPAYISRLVKGERHPSIAVLEILALKLGTTPLFLARGIFNNDEADYWVERTFTYLPSPDYERVCELNDENRRRLIGA